MLVLIYLSAHSETIFYTAYKPPPPVYKPTQNPLRICVSQGLKTGILRYGPGYILPDVPVI